MLSATKTIVCLLIIVLLASGCTFEQKIKIMQPTMEDKIKIKNNTILIGLAGDVMLGRLVNEQISLSNYTYPWGNLLSLLQKNDLNLINLETTLTKSKKVVLKTFNFKADPDKVQSLVEANITVCNLANNHLLDFNEEGLKETIFTLDQANIQHVGAGTNIAEARKPVIIEEKGIKIGILGYTDNEPEWKATENNSGINYIQVGNLEEISKEVKKLRSEVDILILSLHWGPNMKQKPSKEFQQFAHQLIDLGVDILHGHSAHLFQGIEVYKNKIILYDTGDFVDDYYVTPELRNDQSFFYLIELNKQRVIKIQLIPVLISNMQVNLAKGEDYQQTINRVKELSQEFGTKIVEEEKGVFVKI